MQSELKPVAMVFNGPSGEKELHWFHEVDPNERPDGWSETPLFAENKLAPDEQAKAHWIAEGLEQAKVIVEGFYSNHYIEETIVCEQIADVIADAIRAAKGANHAK